MNEPACTDLPNVRTGPGAAYDMMGTLPDNAVGIQGTGASALDWQERTWIQVHFQGRVGWVAEWLLDPEPCNATTCPRPAIPWIITATSVGPIELGMPVSNLDDLTGLNWSWTEDCAVGCLTGTAPGSDAYVIAYQGTVVDEIHVEDQIRAVTADGIRVGDSQMELNAEYGSLVLDYSWDVYGGYVAWIDSDANGAPDMLALFDTFYLGRQ